MGWQGPDEIRLSIFEILPGMGLAFYAVLRFGGLTTKNYNCY